MANTEYQQSDSFSELGKTYEYSPLGWEMYLRDLTLADLYGDWDQNRCPWAWGKLRGALDYLAAEIGPEKAISELREFLDFLENPKECGWIGLHRAGIIKKEGLKLASLVLGDEPPH